MKLRNSVGISDLRTHVHVRVVPIKNGKKCGVVRNSMLIPRIVLYGKTF